MAQKIIPENPCKAVALPEVEPKEMQTIPAEQLQAFLQEAKATGVYKMYCIELATGLRRGELLGLKWTDIDWKNGIIKVRRQIARVDGQIVEAPLKTKGHRIGLRCPVGHLDKSIKFLSTFDMCIDSRYIANIHATSVSIATQQLIFIGYRCCTANMCI